MRELLRLLRPPQWIKNVFVFAGATFGNKLVGPEGLIWDSVFWTLLVFAAFCTASSITYIINDIRDRPHDRLHPAKRDRPLAAGTVTVPQALALAAALLVALSLLLFVGLRARPNCAIIIGVYLVMNLAYSFWAKRVMILDVIVIALGFVLRATAGAEVVDVPLSPWLVVCTFTLCLFLGFGKRRCELAVLGGDTDAAAKHRATLAEYTPELLTLCLTISAGLALVTFLLYTMEPNPSTPFDKQKLMYTLPLVVYGIFRYAMLIASGRVTGPTDIIFRDRPFLLTIILWALAAQLIVLYTPRDPNNVPATRPVSSATSPR